MNNTATHSHQKEDSYSHEEERPLSKPANQPARQSNIDALVSFFESGIKSACGLGDLGIELEHIIVKNDGSPVSYYEEHGVSWLLGELSKKYPSQTTDPEGDLLGVARPFEAVTIEPAAQLELSAGPFSSLDQAKQTFTDFEKLVESILDPVGQRMLTTGYHPSTPARDLALIPKRRYRFMNEYLSRKDIYGPCMMRGSASTQISLDYTSTEDCLRKLRLAFSLAPLLALICDNAPLFEGAPRKTKLVRTSIWQHVDADRCGLVPGVFDPNFSLRDYASYVLDSPAILVPCTTEQWCYTEKSFGELYAHHTMTISEVEHAVSMYFNDVRLKTYIEIRPADSLPIPYVLAYAALLKGLFYSEKNLDELDVLFAKVDAHAYSEAQNALIARGYQAVVYGHPASILCEKLIDLAPKGLSSSEQKYLIPLEKLIRSAETLADQAEK